MTIENMTLEQMAGQRLMVGFKGTRINQKIRYLIETIKVGGVILFSYNISHPEQTQDLCRSLQEHAQKVNQPPLMIALDQEGGKVSRLKKPFTQFKGNSFIKNEDDANHFARVTAKELKSIGINMNMAPVLDVAHDKTESIMADRSFGPDPLSVAKLGARVIDCFQREGIMSVSKHFPGIGRTTLDSHIKMPKLDIDAKHLKDVDFIPFIRAIKHNVAGVMLSHILYQQLDPVWPASLSPMIARKILRDDLGFKGLVVTDDLDMGAIKEHFNIKTIIKQIILSEIDMALICHEGPDIEHSFEEILKSISDSPEIKLKGIHSIKRIFRLKNRFLN